MSERQPRLNIYRDVIDAESWRPRLIDELSQVEGFEPAAISDITFPAGAPRAMVINHTELSKLHASIGQRADEDHLLGLAAHIAKELPQSQTEQVDVATLPAVVHRMPAEPSRRALTVAGHRSVVVERSKALNAILSFYQIGAFPSNTLLRSEYVTAVTIAMGNKSKKARMVEFLGLVINTNGAVLPPRTRLAPVDFEILR